MPWCLADWHVFHSRSSGAALRDVFASTAPSCLQGKWLRWLGKRQVQIQLHCHQEEPLPRPVFSWLPLSHKDCVTWCPTQNPIIFHTTSSGPNKGGGTFYIDSFEATVLPPLNAHLPQYPVSLCLPTYHISLADCLLASISPRVKTRVTEMDHREIQDQIPPSPPTHKHLSNIPSSIPAAVTSGYLRKPTTLLSQGTGKLKQAHATHINKK